MTANVTPLFELTPQAPGQTFVPADTTVLKTLMTAGGFGTRIDSINICSNSTSIENLAFYITVGGVDYMLGTVNIPIGAGYTTIAKVEGLQFLKPAYQNHLVLPASALLKANAVATIAVGKTVTVIVLGGDF